MYYLIKKKLKKDKSIDEMIHQLVENKCAWTKL